MGSKATTRQSSSQTTTQTDNRVGASDSAVVLQGGSKLGSTELNAGGNLSISSLDPDTIKGAFGLSETVVDRLANLATESVRDSQNLVERVGGDAQSTVEKIASGFGSQISSLATQKASGGLNTNLVIALGAMGLIGFFIFSNKRRR